ncbi:GNAT family N-acetyltransferase [Sphingomonas morindae]|uniref:GNAT family N-acetyltransferase n=1 Tax=Sphingomonas morindae TaxID=1541170 RepID=A0ABY4X5K9_9SPHN|nr:GNAT family N-acetyltransferase [Sphingomonas morindae]USI72166.1 GNAT family N-acetyltransferase [Sphingomonas morindae]
MPVTLRLARVTDADPGRGRVPARIYDILDAEGVAVGTIQLRLAPLEPLLRYGGQVGYEVAEAHRGQGHACAALQALVPIARAAGLESLWITCRPDNIASRRTLERAGAALEAMVTPPPGSDLHARGDRLMCRYRLALTP